jgi:hypothetical protein
MATQRTSTTGEGSAPSLEVLFEQLEMAHASCPPHMARLERILYALHQRRTALPQLPAAGERKANARTPAATSARGSTNGGAPSAQLLAPHHYPVASMQVLVALVENYASSLRSPTTTQPAPALPPNPNPHRRASMPPPSALRPNHAQGTHSLPSTQSSRAPARHAAGITPAMTSTTAMHPQPDQNASAHTTALSRTKAPTAVRSPTPLLSYTCTARAAALALALLDHLLCDGLAPHSRGLPALPTPLQTRLASVSRPPALATWPSDLAGTFHTEASSAALLAAFTDQLDERLLSACSVLLRADGRGTNAPKNAVLLRLLALRCVAAVAAGDFGERGEEAATLAQQALGEEAARFASVRAPNRLPHPSHLYAGALLLERAHHTRAQPELCRTLRLLCALCQCSSSSSEEELDVVVVAEEPGEKEAHRRKGAYERKRANTVNSQKVTLTQLHACRLLQHALRRFLVRAAYAAAHAAGRSANLQRSLRTLTADLVDAMHSHADRPASWSCRFAGAALLSFWSGGAALLVDETAAARPDRDRLWESAVASALDECAVNHTAASAAFPCRHHLLRLGMLATCAEVLAERCTVAQLSSLSALLLSTLLSAALFPGDPSLLNGEQVSSARSLFSTLGSTPSLAPLLRLVLCASARTRDDPASAAVPTRALSRMRTHALGCLDASDALLAGDSPASEENSGASATLLVGESELRSHQLLYLQLVVCSVDMCLSEGALHPSSALAAAGLLAILVGAFTGQAGVYHVLSRRIVKLLAAVFAHSSADRGGLLAELQTLRAENLLAPHHATRYAPVVVMRVWE